MRLVNAPDQTPTRYSEAGYFATISSTVVAFLVVVMVAGIHIVLSRGAP